MSTLTVRDISEQLARRSEEICRHLLPNGKRNGREYQVGNIDGEKGSSLQIHLEGAKAGVWSDFATGHGGDLIDLWREVRGISMHQAIQEAKEYLGIREPEFFQRSERTFKPAVKPSNAGASSVANYLTQERKLETETVKAFGVESKQKVVFQRDNITSDAYYLPYMRGGSLIHWKMIGLQRTEKGKKLVTVSPGTEPCLFGWQVIPENARTVVIVEGEVDAMTGYQYGWPCLSVPFGGGVGAKQQWIEHEYDYLERFEEIYLCLDQDAEGKLATEEISKRLGAERCKVVTLPRKDLNQCLQDGISKQEIDRCFQAAKALDPMELKTVADFRAKIMERFYPLDGSMPGYALPWDKTHNNIRLRAGELSLWSGINGHGKSQILGHCMLEVMKAGGKVCIASMELLPDLLSQRMIRQVTGMRQPSPGYIDAAIDWLVDDRLWLFNVTGTAAWERIIDVFKYARKRYMVDTFVIDSLMKCGIAEDDYSTQKKFLDALCDFKTEYECSVHVVMHPRKAQDESKPLGKLDIKGTGALSDLADNTFNVWRNKPKELILDKLEKIADLDDKQQKQLDDALAMHDAILTCDKQRNGEWEGRISLWFDRESLQYMERPTDKPKRYVHYSGEPVFSIASAPPPEEEQPFEMILTDDDLMEVPA